MTPPKPADTSAPVAMEAVPDGFFMVKVNSWYEVDKKRRVDARFFIVQAPDSDSACPLAEKLAAETGSFGAKHLEHKWAECVGVTLPFEMKKQRVSQWVKVDVIAPAPDATVQSEDTRDAARYRWLRADGLGHINFEGLTSDTSDVGLDYAIDAAILTTKPNTGAA